MRRSSYFLFFILALLFHLEGSAAEDSLWVLDRNEFMNIIRRYHPVVLQADLQVKRAEAGVTQARGGFDPVVTTDIDRKSFDGKLYYSYFNPQLTIPTWYGLQVYGGLEEVTGERVTSEATLGKTSYLGVKVSTNELLFDSRRAALRQAQALRSLSETERRLTVNNLMNEAFSVYWEWLKEYQNYALLTNIIQINEERLRFVRIEYQQGNRPAIDTTEVLAQLLSFRQQQSAAWLSFQNTGIALSNYLWLDDAQPYIWNDRIVPDTSILYASYDSYISDILTLVETDVTQHPKMESYRNKLEYLEIERRFKAQYLIPKLSVKANMLNKGYDVPGEINRAFLENNYKLGVDFTMPLFFREARGAYRTSRLKIQETWLERDLEQLKLQNKIREYYNQVVNLREQIQDYESAYLGYVRLYAGERMKFDVGESTLFLLNTRENKVLETRQKLIDLKTKWHKSYTGLLWAAGKFADML